MSPGSRIGTRGRPKAKLVLEAGTIERMARHFQVLLQGIVDQPEQRLADLSLLTEAERYQLLVEWNDTRTEFRSQESEVRRRIHHHALR